MSEPLKRKVKTSPKSRAAAIAGPILGLGIAFAAAAIVLFAWLADEVFEGESVAFDNAVREFVHGMAGDGLTALMQLFSFAASVLVLTTATVVMVVFFILRKQRRRATLLTVVMLGAMVLNFVLKTYFVRVRPAPYFDTPLPSSFSFPSGHSLFSACFCAILAWMFWTENVSRTARIGVWTVACLIVLMVGLSRIYLGVHFPTDVIAGYLAAIVWVSAVVVADSVLERKNV